MFDSTYRYTTLLFDADGTLFDYQKASWEALRRTLAQFALPFSQELFALYQEKNQALWELYELGKVTKDQLEIQRFLHFFDVLKARWQPVREFLKRVRKRAFRRRNKGFYHVFERRLQ